MNATFNADPRLLALLERIATNQETQHETVIKALERIKDNIDDIVTAGDVQSRAQRA
jgi:hypothetical protein